MVSITALHSVVRVHFRYYHPTETTDYNDDDDDDDDDTAKSTGIIIINTPKQS